MNLFATLELLAQRNPGADDAAAAGAVATLFGGIACFYVCIIALWFLGIVAGIAATVFWVWMLIDCITHEQKLPEPENQLVLWLLLIILTTWIGAAVYYFARRPYNRGPHFPQNPQNPYPPNKGF